MRLCDSSLFLVYSSWTNSSFSLFYMGKRKANCGVWVCPTCLGFRFRPSIAWRTFTLPSHLATSPSMGFILS